MADTPLYKATSMEYVPPTHGVICVPCGWHSSDGPHRCTDKRQEDWKLVCEVFDRLFGQTAIRVTLVGRKHCDIPGAVSSPGEPPSRKRARTHR